MPSYRVSKWANPLPCSTESNDGSNRAETNSAKDGQATLPDPQDGPRVGARPKEPGGSCHHVVQAGTDNPERNRPHDRVEYDLALATLSTVATPRDPRSKNHG